MLHSALRYFVGTFLAIKNVNCCKFIFNSYPLQQNNYPEEVLKQILARKFSENRPGLLPAGNARYQAHKILDRKSTRLNSSHVAISYAVFCLKKKNNQ